jgi:hypothetical protein
MVVKIEITANCVSKILKLGFIQNDSKVVWLIILSITQKKGVLSALNYSYQ